MDLQVGKMFIRVDTEMLNQGILKFRVITPVGDTQMSRFDVIVQGASRTVEVQEVYFYPRGARVAELEALNG